MENDGELFPTLSFSIFDSEGRLIDWNDGFANEYSDAVHLLRPGVSVSEISQSSLIPKQALDLSWTKNGMPPIPFSYINNHHSIEVTQEFSNKGNILRVAMPRSNHALIDPEVDLLRSSALKVSASVLSHRVQLEESLRKAHAEAEERAKQLEAAQIQLLLSDRMASIGQLAAGIAHEINNPLGFIKSNFTSLSEYVDNLLAINNAYLEVEEGYVLGNRPTFERVHQLKRNADYEFIVDDLHKLIAESRDGLDRVHLTVNDLQDFSRVGESEWQWADLHQGIDSALNVAANEIKYKVKVTRQYGGLPLVHCIPSQLNQVFLNLLVNAAHSISEQGHITIRTDCDENQVWVEVQDDGVGIAPEYLNRIFDSFFTTKPVDKGKGLGLSLSLGIVQRHKGKLEVESELGKGTTFRMTIPIDSQGSVEPLEGHL